MALACLLSGLAPVSAQTVPVTPAPAAVYEDQYLFDGTETVGLVAPLTGDQPLGRRQLEIESIFYSNSDDFFGDETENGLSIRWLQETATLGTFDVEAMMSDVDSEFTGRQLAGTDSVLTVRQSQLAVSSTSLMNSTLGHQRIATDSLLHGGYRFRLPSTTLLGASSEVSGDGRQLRLVTGQIGRYRGVRMPGFEKTGGRLTSVAYGLQVTELMEIGTELIAVSGDDDVRDHTSAIFGMRHTSPDESREHAARMIRDSRGNIGIWSDSLQELGLSQSIRYGVFHMDRDLAWADQPTTNDQQGAYVRVNSGNARLNLIGGYDWQRSGLRSDIQTVVAHSAFFNTSLRVRRDLQFGISTSLGSRDRGSVAGTQTTSRLRVYSNWTVPVGSFRFEIFDDAIGALADTADYSRDGVATTFNWRMPERIRLSTELRLEREHGPNQSHRRQELSAYFQYDLLDDISLSLNASLFQSSGDALAGDDGLSLSADLDWRFRPDWRASLTLSRNQTDYGDETSLILPTLDEYGATSVWLSIRYGRTTGRAFPQFGTNTAGSVGNGRITGTVFFDENGDSIWQPSEQVAVGAVVIVDGRYEARTNAQGRYSISPVPAGDHTVAVLIDDIPLPWGLDDERPRQIPVGFRQDARIDFPLIVIE